MKMVRVGFHLHNDGQETVDCSRIIYGNPGIGGAEYAIIAIAYMLSVDKNDIEVLRHEIILDIAFADDFGFLE
jgi:hypothetical protein